MAAKLEPWAPGDARVPPGSHLHDRGTWYHEHEGGGQHHEHERLPWNAHRTKDRAYTGRGAGGTGGSIALIVAGIVIMAYLGRNYGVCQNVLVQAASSGACAQASLWHWAGIIIAVIGGLCFIEEIARGRRR